MAEAEAGSELTGCVTSVPPELEAELLPVLPERVMSPAIAPPPRPPQGDAPPPPPISQEASQFFSRILDKLPLKGVDTADILLLLILFFLFEEKADDELLVALGLLLIL